MVQEQLLNVKAYFPTWGAAVDALSGELSAGIITVTSCKVIQVLKKLCSNKNECQ